MARVNIDDDLESQDEFWALLEIYKDRDLCLGKLIRFFRIAQRRFGHRQILTKNDLSMQGLEVMIETGWALPQGDGGFQVRDAAKHFNWYRQKIDASKKGVEAKQEKRESNDSGDLPLPASDVRESGTLFPVNPPSPSPVPSPVIKKNFVLSSDDSAFAVVAELHPIAEIIGDRKIKAELQRRWLEKFSAEYIIEKVKDLKIWELTAGPKGKKQNWGRFYSYCLGKDWDKWIARRPSSGPRSQPAPRQTPQTAHSAPSSNWVNDLIPEDKR